MFQYVSSVGKSKTILNYQRSVKFVRFADVHRQYWLKRPRAVLKRSSSSRFRLSPLMKVAGAQIREKVSLQVNFAYSRLVTVLHSSHMRMTYDDQFEFHPDYCNRIPPVCSLASKSSHHLPLGKASVGLRWTIVSSSTSKYC